MDLRDKKQIDDLKAMREASPVFKMVAPLDWPTKSHRRYYQKRQKRMEGLINKIIALTKTLLRR